MDDSLWLKVELQYQDVILHCVCYSPGVNHGRLFSIIDICNLLGDNSGGEVIAGDFIVPHSAARHLSPFLNAVGLEGWTHYVTSDTRRNSTLDLTFLLGLTKVAIVFGNGLPISFLRSAAIFSRPYPLKANVCRYAFL